MSSSTAGPGGSTERLHGSLRNSAIARLLVEGRLSSSSPTAADKVDDRRRRAEVHSPPPPIDLSTNKTSSKQVNVNDSAAAAAAVASFSLSTITMMEKLRCILACEVQSLLSRVSSTDQSISSSNSIRYSCRLCPFNASQVIELLSHYRFHGDTLAHIGHSSPDILSGWFEYYLKTSPMRCSSQSLAGANEALGVMTPAADSSSSSSSSPAFRLDLRTLLLQPFKATNALLLSSSGDHRSPGRHSACSESQQLKPGCRANDGGAQSRSSTPYTMISGLTDDENQQQTIVYAGDRCPRWGPINGRQSAGVYSGEVSIKCETDDTTASPVRSPVSTNSERSVKDKGPNSQDSQSPDAEYLGQFQNGRLQGLAGGRMAEDRSPPTLKCEVDSSPYTDDRVSVSHCFEYDDRYLGDFRGHMCPKEALRKSSNVARLLHPGLRACNDRSPSLSCSSHPGPSGSPSKDTALPVDHPEDGQQTGRQSKSPAPTQFRETVEQEYAYKQYKRLRKSTTPKSCRQEASVSPFHSLSKTPDNSGLSGTPSLPCDGSEIPQRGCVTQLVGTERSCISTKRAPQSYEIGVQCSLISPVEPCISVAEEDEDDDDEEAEDETKEEMSRVRRSRRRVRKKRAFPADENEMPDITASDADCVQTRCSPCGITFDDDVIFSIHMGCHSHTDPFVCNICGRPCDNKYTFNTHILRGHHPT